MHTQSHYITQSMHFCDKKQPTTVLCGTDIIDNGKSGTVPEVQRHLEGTTSDPTHHHL